MNKYVVDPKFPVDQVIVTGAAVKAMKGKHKVIEWLLARHQSGDWGILSDDDKLTNDTAVVTGHIVKSIYLIDGVGFHLITEADRKRTIILLTDEC